MIWSQVIVILETIVEQRLCFKYQEAHLLQIACPKTRK